MQPCLLGCLCRGRGGIPRYRNWERYEVFERSQLQEELDALPTGRVEREAICPEPMERNMYQRGEIPSDTVIEEATPFEEWRDQYVVPKPYAPVQYILNDRINAAKRHIGLPLFPSTQIRLISPKIPTPGQPLK